MSVSVSRFIASPIAAARCASPMADRLQTDDLLEA
jgi:hypothetical protein